MADPDTYEVLQEIFAEVFLRDDIQVTPQLSADDVEGWDSFKQMELIISAEERFGVKLDTKEIDGVQCVGDLAAIVRANTE